LRTGQSRRRSCYHLYHVRYWMFPLHAFGENILTPEGDDREIVCGTGTSCCVNWLCALYYICFCFAAKQQTCYERSNEFAPGIFIWLSRLHVWLPSSCNYQSRGVSGGIAASAQAQQRENFSNAPEHSGISVSFFVGDLRSN
jgi:hypothetical protein